MNLCIEACHCSLETSASCLRWLGQATVADATQEKAGMMRPRDQRIYRDKWPQVCTCLHWFGRSEWFWFQIGFSSVVLRKAELVGSRAKCFSPAPNLKSCAPNAVMVSSDCHKLRLEYPQRGFGFWSWLLADQGNRSWSLPGQCARSIGKGIMHRGRLGGQWGPSWETRIVACIHICPHAIAILQA